MKIFRLLALALILPALAACSSSSRQPKSSARMYDGDESPHIKMYNEDPGSPLNN